MNYSIFCLIIIFCSVFLTHSVRSRDFTKKVKDVFKKVKSAAKAEIQYIAMAPGTKWCGPGNIANKLSDLGQHKKVDECCRDHDHCPGAIPPGGTRHNLTNKSIFARSPCKCDKSLHECLRSIHNITALKSGLWFYDALGMKCYKKDYPVIRCNKRGGWLKSKCIEYVFNTTAEQRYQCVRWKTGKRPPEIVKIAKLSIDTHWKMC